MLPRDNLQQVDSVFDIYMTTGDQGYKLSREFKLTFAYDELPLLLLCSI